MARRLRHRYRAPSGRSRSALLRLDRTLMTRTSVRSALDACPNAAKRFPTRPELCSVPRESFWFDASRPFLFRRGQADEFLETRIVPERIEHRVEPDQGGSERRVHSQRPLARYRKYFL